MSNCKKRVKSKVGLILILCPCACRRFKQNVDPKCINPDDKTNIHKYSLSHKSRKPFCILLY